MSLLRALGLSLVLVLPAQGCTNDPFLQDLGRVPGGFGQDRNITAVVEKHIRSGMPLQVALQFVEQRGFKVYPWTTTGPPNGEKWFVAVREGRHMVLFSEQTRVFIESDGERVLRSRGRVYFRDAL